jgi:phosphate transport system permease protein
MSTVVSPSAAPAAGGSRGAGAALGRGRTARDRFIWGLCGLAFLLIVAPAVSILISVFHQAAPDLSLSLFTKTTVDTSGLRNAILGTLLLLAGVLIVAGTIGVAAGIWLAEFAPPRLGGALRFLSEVLSGSPSIVIGYVGYTALVVGFHWNEGLLPAVIALSTLVLPYVVKTTEVALRQVPSALREATEALGLYRATAVARIILPPAVPGIVSGLIIALAISTGETAPLLFTAGFSNSNPTFHLLHHRLGYLTYVTFTNISQPNTPGHNYSAQGAAAAAVTLVILIALIFLGRLVSSRARRATSRMSL